MLLERNIIMWEIKTCTIRIFLFIIICGITLPQSNGVAYENVESDAPNFSITIQMDKRKVYGINELEIGFQILGKGDYDSGILNIQSDAVNLKTNSIYYVQGILTDPNEIEYQKKFREYFIFNFTSNQEQYAQNIHEPLGLVNTTEYIQHMIFGSFSIKTWDGHTTKTLSPGQYMVKIVLLVENDGTHYIFEESVEYEVANRWNEWNKIIIPVFLSAVIAYFLDWYKEARTLEKSASLRKREKTKPR